MDLDNDLLYTVCVVGIEILLHPGSAADFFYYSTEKIDWESYCVHKVVQYSVWGQSINVSFQFRTSTSDVSVVVQCYLLELFLVYDQHHWE